MSAVLRSSNNGKRKAAEVVDVDTQRVGKRKRTVSQKLEESRAHAENKKARMDTKKQARSANGWALALFSAVQDIDEIIGDGRQPRKERPDRLGSEALGIRSPSALRTCSSSQACVLHRTSERDVTEGA